MAKDTESIKCVILTLRKENVIVPNALVAEIISFNDFDKGSNQLLKQQAVKIVLAPDSGASLKDIEFDNAEKSGNTIEIFIGPEGGLNSDEIKLLENNQFKKIGFGPRILRTETAGPAVISALQTLWGDF